MRGRLPEPDALRRDRRTDAGWTVLPVDGRPGTPPRWPLSPSASTVERDLWKREWSRPQAVMWQRSGLDIEVALYVRTLVEAGRRGATAALRELVVRQQRGLGISLEGLLRNRWVIADGETSSSATAASTAARSASDIKQRTLHLIADEAPRR